MSQLIQARELVEKLVQASQKVHMQPELNTLIQQLASTVLNRSQTSNKESPYSFPEMTDVDTNLVNLESISEQLDQVEIINMTQSVLTIFEMMKIVIQFSLNTKKPQQSQVQGINQILHNKIQSIVKNYPNHSSHTKILSEGLQSISWVFNDQPNSLIENSSEQAKFHSQKITQLNDNLQTQWVNQFLNALQSLNIYVKQHFERGLTWNLKGDQDFSDLYSLLRGDIKVILDRSKINLNASSSCQITVQPIAQQAVQQPVQQVQQPVQQVQQPPVQVQNNPTPVVQQQQIQQVSSQQQQAPQVQSVPETQQNVANYPPMSDFEKNLSDFESAGQKLDPELQELTSLIMKAFEFMKSVMIYSKALKKPQQDNIKQISTILNDKIFKPINSSKAGIKFPNHLKMTISGLSAVAWVLSDTPKMNIDNGIESSEFYGNKILLQKQPEHTAWNNSFKAALKSLIPYVMTNFTTGLLWNFKGTDDYSELYQVLKGEKSVQQITISQSSSNASQIPQTQAVQNQSSAESFPPMTDFDQNINDFKAASDKLDSEVQELSEFIIKAFDLMKEVMRYSKQNKKPEQENIKQISTIFNDKVFKPMNSSKAGIKYPNHLKTALQGLSAVLWVISETPKMALDNGIESSEFYGNKILLMKQPEHTAWYNSFKAALKSLVPYVLQNFTTGLLWKFNGQTDYSDLYSVLRGEKKSEQTTQPATQNPPPPSGLPPPPPPPPMLNITPIKLEDYAPKADTGAMGALLSSLNVGEDAIKAHLKHVNKGEKYESKKPAQPSSQPTTTVKKQEVTKVVKEPKKYQKDNWFVENYVNERIEFQEGEIQLKQSLFIENCNNSTIIVKGKIKSVFVNKCKKTKVLVTNAVSGVEAVDCASCEIYISEAVPSIQIDKSDTVRVIFLKDKNCDIVTSKSSGINVTYATNDEGDMEKDTPIPEQFITKWNNETNSFQTKTLDTFL